MSLRIHSIAIAVSSLALTFTACSSITSEEAAAMPSAVNLAAKDSKACPDVYANKKCIGDEFIATAAGVNRPYSLSYQSDAMPDMQLGKALLPVLAETTAIDAAALGQIVGQANDLNDKDWYPLRTTGLSESVQTQPGTDSAGGNPYGVGGSYGPDNRDIGEAGSDGGAGNLGVAASLPTDTQTVNTANEGTEVYWAAGTN